MRVQVDNDITESGVTNSEKKIGVRLNSSTLLTKEQASLRSDITEELDFEQDIKD